MTECGRCGATANRASGVVIGTIDGADETVCNDCRAETLTMETKLSEQEAAVAAAEQLAAVPTKEVAEILDCDAAAVERLDAQIRSEIDAAAKTLNMLDRSVGLDRLANADSVEHTRAEVETLQRTVSELGDLR
ncbi:hypothetical protein [Halobellus ordinarius]|uniref:hypothetical protein n=1 Tax=Halobellus ordinarius TaxID=3075120 RepID=UPI00287FF6C9|nr:hypothetical protein [Halobellus sp. ZY16]